MKVAFYSKWSLNESSIRFSQEGLLYQSSGLSKQVVSNTGLTLYEYRPGKLLGC